MAHNGGLQTSGAEKSDSLFRGTLGVTDEATLSNIHLGICLPVRAVLVWYFVYRQNATFRQLLFVAALTSANYIRKALSGRSLNGVVWWDRHIDFGVSLAVVFLSVLGISTGSDEYYKPITVILGTDVAHGAYNAITKRWK